MEKSLASRITKKITKILAGLGQRNRKGIRVLPCYESVVLLALLVFTTVFCSLPMPELNWDAGRLGISGVFWHDAIRNVVLTGRFDSAEEFVETYSNQYESDFFYYPVFWGLICSGSFFFFGISEGAFYLVVLFFALASIVATYLLGSKLYDQRIGVISSLFLASSHALFGYTKSGTIDVPAAAMVTLSMFVFLKAEAEKRWVYSVLAGVLIGLSFMTKPTTAIIAVPITFCLLLKYLRSRFKRIGNLMISRIFEKENLRRRFHNYIILSILALILFLIQMRVWINSGMISAYLYNVSGPPTFTFPWYIYLCWIVTDYLSPIVVCLFMIGFLFSLSRRNDADIFLLTWFVTSIFFATLTSNKQPRYLLMLVPCLSIMAAQGLVSFYNLVREKLKFQGRRVSSENLTKMLFILLIISGIINGSLLIRENPYFWVDFENIDESPYGEVAKFLVEKEGIILILPGGKYYSPPTLWFHVLKYDRQRSTCFYTATGPWAAMSNETFIAALDSISDYWDGKTVYVVVIYGFDVEGWEGLLQGHVQPLQKYVAYIESHSELVPLIKVFASGSIHIGIYQRIKGAF